MISFVILTAFIAAALVAGVLAAASLAYPERAASVRAWLAARRRAADYHRHRFATGVAHHHAKPGAARRLAARVWPPSTPAIAAPPTMPALPAARTAS